MRRATGVHMHGWACDSRPSVILGASTITRVVDKGEEDPEFIPRPVGFTANIEKEQS
jgi:hypothetical protein